MACICKRQHRLEGLEGNEQVPQQKGSSEWLHNLFTRAKESICMIIKLAKKTRHLYFDSGLQLFKEIGFQMNKNLERLNTLQLIIFITQHSTITEVYKQTSQYFVESVGHAILYYSEYN